MQEHTIVAANNFFLSKSEYAHKLNAIRIATANALRLTKFAAANANTAAQHIAKYAALIVL